MAAPGNGGKLYHLFTFGGASSSAASEGRGHMVVGIAVAMFIALFGWGAEYFGWSDPDGKVQLALATSFILGILGGFKSRG
jgi:hypothetical protein